MTPYLRPNARASAKTSQASPVLARARQGRGEVRERVRGDQSVTRGASDVRGLAPKSKRLFGAAGKIETQRPERV